MITIFLKHQKDKDLDSLQAIQKKNNFSGLFPPASARVVSWYVMMGGIGQVVTVKIPAAELRTLNRSIERGAWGALTLNFMRRTILCLCGKSSFKKLKGNKIDFSQNTFYAVIFLN